MTDTDVTLHILQYCRSYPYIRHDPYLPSSPVSLQALDRMEYAMVDAVASPDVRIVSPHIVVFFYFPSVQTYKREEPGKTGRHPGSSRVPTPTHSLSFVLGTTVINKNNTREQLCNMYCSNKHTHT